MVSEVICQLGQIQLASVRDGLFKLDGGAMFGIVPRPVWEKVAKPDERHRIQLGLNPLLIRTPSKNILVDTGIGNKYDAKWNDQYAIDHKWTVPASLKRVGLSVNDIHYVVPTHMHFDHMGGATVRESGKVVPTYPKAMYVVQEREWAAALTNNPRTRGSYLDDDFLPIEAANRLKLIDGDEELTRGVTVRHTNAHTPGHQIVMIESDGQKAVYLGDLMPTAHHLKPAWCMGYDVFPMEVARFKAEFLERAAKENWVLIFDHDVTVAMARVIKEGSNYNLLPTQMFGRDYSDDYG
jgi:glyoxylase-like metal-dependent hydrolase (beta-lactamase superfamily II)